MSFKRFFTVILCFSCFGCSNEQVRIVGNDGKRVRLNAIVPEFNQQQLEKQKQAMSEYGTISNFRQDYNAKPINNMNSEVKQENTMIPGNYPDYIFADRVNSYDDGNDFGDNYTPSNIKESKNSTSFSDVDIDTKPKKINKFKENFSKKVDVGNSKSKYKLVLNNKISNIEDTAINKIDKKDLNKSNSSFKSKQLTIEGGNDFVLSKNNIIKENIVETTPNIVEKKVSINKKKSNVVAEKQINNTANKIDNGINDAKNNNIGKDKDAKISAILSSGSIKADEIGTKNTVTKLNDNKVINNNVQPTKINADNAKTVNNVVTKNNDGIKAVDIKVNAVDIKNYNDTGVKNVVTKLNDNKVINNNVQSTKINADNAKTVNSAKQKVVSSNNYYIQLGVYSDKKNADTICERYLKIGSCLMEVYNKKYKVVLGPYSDKNIAERDLEQVIKTGHFDVYITNKK